MTITEKARDTWLKANPKVAGETVLIERGGVELHMGVSRSERGNFIKSYYLRPVSDMEHIKDTVRTKFASLPAAERALQILVNDP